MEFKRLGFYFNLFLLLLSLFLTFCTFQYSFRSRIVPLVVLILLDCMTAVLVLTHVFPSLERRWAFLKRRGLSFSSSGPSGDSGRKKEESNGGRPPVDGVKLLRLCIWLFATFFAMLFIDYTVLFPLVVFLLMVGEHKAKWPISIVVALIVGIFNFVLFHQFLHLRM
jgi:hypothetical protein